MHPIHAHKHYDFLTKGTRRLLIANSLYIVDASEFALDPFQLDIIVHKSDFVPSLVLNIISYLKENFQEPMISSPKNFPSPKPL